MTSANPFVGMLIGAGWEETGTLGEDRVFVARIRLDSPAAWPMEAVWQTWPVTVSRAETLSPTPDGVIKERDGRRPDGPGLSMMLIPTNPAPVETAIAYTLCRGENDDPICPRLAHDGYACAECACEARKIREAVEGEAVLAMWTALEAASPVVDATSGGEAPGRDEGLAYEADERGAWTWIVWAIQPAGPQLAAIASTEAKAEGYRDTVAQSFPGAKFFTERAPVNHVFGAADLRSIAGRAAAKSARQGFAAPRPSHREG